MLLQKLLVLSVLQLQAVEVERFDLEARACCLMLVQHTSAYVSIRQRTSAYVEVEQVDLEARACCLILDSHKEKKKRPSAD